MASNQRHHRVRTAHALVHFSDSSKHISWGEWHALCGFFKLVRQHIEQHFRIALGINMAMVCHKQLRLQRVRVGQIAVVHEHDPKRRVNIKRLRLFFAERIACSWITHLAQTAITRQRAHIAGAEHVFDHALGFVHEKFTV